MDEDSPLTFPVQPRPSATKVARLKIFKWWATAVVRLWQPGESGERGRCALCKACTASGNMCLVVVPKFVADADAPLLSTLGLRDQEARLGIARTDVVPAGKVAEGRG